MPIIIQTPNEFAVRHAVNGDGPVPDGNTDLLPDGAWIEWRAGRHEANVYTLHDPPQDDEQRLRAARRYWLRASERAAADFQRFKSSLLGLYVDHMPATFAWPSDGRYGEKPEGSDEAELAALTRIRDVVLAMRQRTAEIERQIEDLPTVKRRRLEAEIRRAQAEREQIALATRRHRIADVRIEERK